MYRPWENRRFGIEMEMNSRTVDGTDLHASDIRRVMEAALQGYPAGRLNAARPAYYHSSGRSWDIKTDSSCGWEVASPAMMMTEDAECPELKAVCDALTSLRPRVDDTCGLHVSIDCRDFSWTELQKLAKLFIRYEPLFFELTPPKRRDNSYCSPWRKATWQGSDSYYLTDIVPLLDTQDESRFQYLSSRAPRGSMNVGNWWQNGRVEFRLQAGTVNYEKIIRWAQLMMAVVARAKHPTMPAPWLGSWSDKGLSVRYVFQVLGLAPSPHLPASEIPPESARLLAWAQARKARFATATHTTSGTAVDEATSRGAY